MNTAVAPIVRYRQGSDAFGDPPCLPYIVVFWRVNGNKLMVNVEHLAQLSIVTFTHAAASLRPNPDQSVSTWYAWCKFKGATDLLASESAGLLGRKSPPPLELLHGLLLQQYRLVWRLERLTERPSNPI